MTSNQIVIRGMAVYHPEHCVDNQYFIDEYKKHGHDITNLLAYLGKEKRYLSPHEEENTLTMGIEASKKVLEQEGLKGSDMDIMIFASGVHEYHVPPDVCFLHQAIEGKHNCMVYDLNANCVGMIVAVDQAITHMKSNPSIQYALVVGSERMIQYTKKSDVVNSVNFGDASCAVILERVSDENRGFVKSMYHTDSSFADMMKLPNHGMSRLFDESILLEEKKIWMHPEFSSLAIVPSVVQNISLMLKEQGILLEDIKRFFISQVTLSLSRVLAEQLCVSTEKFEYVGDRYGYTGVSSPFIALKHAIENGSIQRGDWFVLWSVGAGSTSCVLLGKL